MSRYPRKAVTGNPDIFKSFAHKIPESYRKTGRRAFSGNSLRAAATMKCLDCVGYQRVEVAKCQIKKCSLWLYRPYKKMEPKQESEEET